MPVRNASSVHPGAAEAGLSRSVLKELLRVAKGAVPIAVGLGLILYFLPADPTRERARGARVSVSSSTDPSLGGLKLQGWLQQSRVYRGQTVRLRFIFENHSARKITGLRFVDLQAPGFEWPPSWTAHIEGPARIRWTGSQLDPDLNPGETETIEADLKPTRDSYGVFSVTAFVGWDRAATAASPVAETVHVPIALGPVEITTPWREHLALFSNRTYRVGKDLTLPVLLALLAYLFQKRQQGLEAIDQRQRDDREKRDHDQREQRERSQQIWNSQLPRLHEIAEKHYLPIVTTIRYLGDAWGRLPNSPVKKKEQQVNLCLYCFLLALRRFKFLRDEKGSLFFKDRSGEEVASAALFSLYFHVKKQFGEDGRERILKRIEVTDDFDKFLQKLQHDDVLQHCREVFVAWIEDTQITNGSFPQCLHILTIVRHIFKFEANRPFDEFWYGSPAKFDVDSVDSGQFPVEPKDDIKALISGLTAYQAATKEYFDKWQEQRS